MEKVRVRAKEARREARNKMPKGSHRAHTPIVSKKEQGKFGSELARRRAGKEPQMPGITTEELESHLHESKGKDLPKQAKHYDGASHRKGGYRAKR